MQTPSVVPVSKENSTGHKIFYGVFGTILVIVYLMTFWVFLNGAALLTGGGRASATVTKVEDATTAGTPGAVSTSPANATNFNIKTNDNANQYTFHFKTEDGQEIEKAYVSTALDVIKEGSQVNIIYNRSDPEDFIMDGFLPIFFHIGTNCLLFVTLTAAIIVCLVRLRIIKARAAAR
jgi:hypothetical protein